jgi:hypothetical protein
MQLVGGGHSEPIAKYWETLLSLSPLPKTIEKGEKNAGVCMEIGRAHV